MNKNHENLFSEIAIASNIGFASMLAENLAQMILTGKLPAGYSLPNENEMCKLLSVSRSTLREAYKALDTLGYISRTKTGTVVSDVHSLALKGAFDTSLKLSRLNELIEFITLLEPHAAYLAAQRATDEEIEEIRVEMEICAGYGGDIALLEEHNRSFHEKIRLAAHNAVLTSAIAASFTAFDEFIVKPVYSTKPETLKFLDNCILEHAQYYEAIVARDGERAREVAKRHLMSDVQMVQGRSQELIR